MMDIPIETNLDTWEHAWLIYETGNDDQLPHKKRLRYYHEAFSLALATKDPYLQALVLKSLAQNARSLEQRLNRYQKALETARKIAHMDLIAELINTLSKDILLSIEQRLCYCYQTLFWSQGKASTSLQAYIFYQMGNLTPFFTQRLQYYEQALDLARDSHNISLKVTIRFVYENLHKQHQKSIGIDRHVYNVKN